MRKQCFEYSGRLYKSKKNHKKNKPVKKLCKERRKCVHTRPAQSHSHERVEKTHVDEHVTKSENVEIQEELRFLLSRYIDRFATLYDVYMDASESAYFHHDMSEREQLLIECDYIDQLLNYLEDCYKHLSKYVGEREEDLVQFINALPW
jgi:hypothetical protein